LFPRSNISFRCPFQNISDFPRLESLDSKSRKSLKSILNKLYYRFLIQEQQLSLNSYLSLSEFRYCFYKSNFKPEQQLTVDKTEIVTAANSSHTNFPDSPNLRKAEMGNIPVEKRTGVAETNGESSSSSPSLFLCCFGRNKIHHFHEDADFNQPRAAPEDKSKTEIKSVSIMREKKLTNRLLVLDNSQRNSAAESYRQLQKILSPLIPSLNSFYYQLKYFEVRNDGNSLYLKQIKAEQQQSQPVTEEESKNNNNIKHDHHLVLQSVEDDSENNKEIYQKENEHEKDNIPSCSAENSKTNEDILKVFLYQNVGIVFQSEGDYNQHLEKTEEIIDFLEWIQFCFHQNIFPDVEIIPE
jgi:hypothetical protein